MSLLDHSVNFHDIVFLEQLCTFRSFHECMFRTGFEVVADNESKMAKMRDILKEKFPDLITYGCPT